ncbi:hypothetical protein R1flu_011854 [Riccia fluitans]|uniref:Uncharacterized protein n=1 Tax=Riccia fluitans TaxID=41844 RepID=A0ABD1ZD53_9MARC
MCYPVKCSTCSKTTWAGCGRHVPSVYANVPAGQACTCKPWPGVELPKKENSSDAKTETNATPTPEAGSVTK